MFTYNTDIDLPIDIKHAILPSEYIDIIPLLLKKFDNEQQLRINDLIDRVYTSIQILEELDFKIYLRNIVSAIKTYKDFKVLNKLITHYTSFYTRNVKNLTVSKKYYYALDTPTDFFKDKI